MLYKDIKNWLLKANGGSHLNGFAAKRLVLLAAILTEHFFRKSKRLNKFCIEHKINQLSIF